MSGNGIYRHKLMVDYALMFFSKVILGVKIQNVCSMCIKINKVGKQEVGI
jgi:hypothetical protein